MANNIETYSGKSIAQQLLGDTKIGKWLWGNNTYTDGYGAKRKDASFKESANGQLVERMAETAKDTGNLVATGLAFGNPLTAGSVMSPLITASQAYWIANGINDGRQRIENLVEDPNLQDAAMLALDVAGAVPVAKTVATASKHILPIARNYAEYKILKPSYNYLAKNGVIGYKDVPEGMLKLPTTKENPILNVGWAPKQTINIKRAGDLDTMYYPERWDVTNEGANPFGVWLQGKFGIPRTDVTNPDKGAKAAAARKIFADRKQYAGEVTLEKPMQTVGEIPNRSNLSYAAERMGADGIIYNNVYDNGYNNNQVIFSFKKPKLDDSIPYRQKQSSIAPSSSSGTELATPMEAIEEIKKGRAMAGSFFKHPVVKESYAHNQELAKRLGIDLPDRPADISDMVTRPVKVGWNTNDNEIANVAQGYYGDPNVTMNFQWSRRPKSEWGAAARHESMHLGYYSAPIRPKIVTKDIYDNTVKPTAQFWNWKTQKLLKPEYKNGYLSDVWGGEAGPNLIDIGRDLGVKLGQKYPGDVEFLKMLDSYRGHKSFLVPQLATDTKSGRRHVWDAMTGKYFAAPLIGVSGAYAVSNEEN